MKTFIFYCRSDQICETLQGDNFFQALHSCTWLNWPLIYYHGRWRLHKYYNESCIFLFWIGACVGSACLKCVCLCVCLSVSHTHTHACTHIFVCTRATQTISTHSITHNMLTFSFQLLNWDKCGLYLHHSGLTLRSRYICDWKKKKVMVLILLLAPTVSKIS